MHAGAGEGIRFPGLELQILESLPTWVLGTDSGLLQEQYVLFSPQAISPAQGHLISLEKSQWCIRLTLIFFPPLSLLFLSFPLSSSPSPLPLFLPFLLLFCLFLLIILDSLFHTSTRKTSVVSYSIMPRDLLVHIHINRYSMEIGPANMSNALTGQRVSVCQGPQELVSKQCSKCFHFKIEKASDFLFAVVLLHVLSSLLLGRPCSLTSFPITGIWELECEGSLA